MSPVLTFICAGAGIVALLAAIGLLLGPSDPSDQRGRRRQRARRTPRRVARGRRLTARRARAMSAIQSAHVRDLSAASDEADGSG